MFMDGRNLGSLGWNWPHDVVPFTFAFTFTFTSFSFSLPHRLGCWLGCRLGCWLGCWRWRAFALAATFAAAAALAFALQNSFVVRLDIMLQQRALDRLNLLDKAQNMETTTHQRDRGIRGSRARVGEFVYLFVRDFARESIQRQVKAAGNLRKGERNASPLCHFCLTLHPMRYFMHVPT
jgi:hypothetical protein